MTTTTQAAAELPALSDEQIASIYARWSDTPGASHADLMREAARAALAATSAPAMPEGWRLVEKKTHYQLVNYGANEVVALLSGPNAEANAATIARVLAAPTPAAQTGQSPAEVHGAEREKFETRFPKPNALTWNGSGYDCKDGWENSYAINSFCAQWIAWQARAALESQTQPKHTAPEHLPTKEHIRELAQEALDQIMEQAHVFASAWSLVGGPFDSGNALSDAEEAKAELRTMVRSLADLAAETVRPAAQAPAPAHAAERAAARELLDAWDDHSKGNTSRRLRLAFDGFRAALDATGAAPAPAVGAIRVEGPVNPGHPRPRYRLRKPSESLEHYRIAMGWDKQVAAVGAELSDAQIDKLHDSMFPCPLLEEDRAKVRTFVRAAMAQGAKP